MYTRLTELLAIRFPIIQGAMQWLARAPLAAAVSQAGGLGVINAKTFADPQDLAREIALVRRQTDRPFAVNVSMLPEVAGPEDVWGYFQVCLDQAVPVVETAGRSPAPFIGRLKEAGIKVLHKVPAVRYALSAEKAGVDAVTVVGQECGGHPGMDGVGSMVLIPRAAQALRAPLIAGGGVADGRGLAAALALGADGVVMGTRFLLAEEVDLPGEVRQRLIQAQETATTLVMTSLGNAARVLDNDLAREIQSAEASGGGFEAVRPLVSGERSRQSLQSGDVEQALLALGQGVGLIDRVMPAAEIIAATVAEAREAASRLNTIMESDD